MDTLGKKRVKMPLFRRGSRTLRKGAQGVGGRGELGRMPGKKTRVEEKKKQKGIMLKARQLSVSLQTKK